MGYSWKKIATGGIVTEVGVREFRDGLSRYLAQVRRGARVTVTDHGCPIAEVAPLGEDPIERLIAQGTIQPAKRPRYLPTPVATTGSVSELVAEQRQ